MRNATVFRGDDGWRLVAFEGALDLDEIDQVLAEHEASEAAEFDAKLVEALLKQAAEVGELRLVDADELIWLLRVIGTFDHIVRMGYELPETIQTMAGPVRIVLERGSL